jgi:hypothetical protein
MMTGAQDSCRLEETQSPQHQGTVAEGLTDGVVAEFSCEIQWREAVQDVNWFARL